MPQLPLVPFKTLNEVTEPTLTRVQSFIAASFRPVNTSPFLNGTYFSEVLSGTTLSLAVGGQGSRFFTFGPTVNQSLLPLLVQRTGGGNTLIRADAATTGDASLTVQSSVANRGTWIFGNSNPGVQIFSDSTGVPLVDWGRTPGQTDWRMVQDNPLNNLNITPFNSGVGKIVNVQAPLRTSRGLLMVVDCGSLYTPAGAVYSGTLMTRFTQNSGTTAAQYIAPFSGSVIAVTYRQDVAIPAGQSSRVDFTRDFSAPVNGNSFGAGLTGGITTYSKGTLTFSAGQVLGCRFSTSYSYNNTVQASLTIEMDP